MPKAARVRMHRTVKPSTIKLLAMLADALEMSQGRVIDLAIEAAAVSSSFGPQALRQPIARMQQGKLYAVTGKRKAAK